MIILVDTSVWVEHLQRGNAALADFLRRSMVLVHPFVLGELALGNLQQRAQVLGAVQNLPQARVADAQEVLHLIGTQVLHGMGIGYVDAHLLASVRLTAGSALWTHDKRLAAAATRMGASINALQQAKPQDGGRCPAGVDTLFP